MSEQDNSNFLAGWRLQDYLSFGYLYLLVLGVVSDSLYYGLIGINVVSYSTALDVLLSPIVKLTDSWLFPAAVLLTPALTYFYVPILKQADEKKLAKKRNKFPDRDIPDSRLLRQPRHTVWFELICVFNFAMFIGFGLGAGVDQRKELQEGTFSLTSELVFQDGTTALVRVFGHNSEYIFYARDGDNTVSASPIKDSLVSMRELSEDEKAQLNSDITD